MLGPLKISLLRNLLYEMAHPILGMFLWLCLLLTIKRVQTVLEFHWCTGEAQKIFMTKYSALQIKPTFWPFMI